jgi:6-phosphogluconate dehydrogenase
MNAGVIAVPHGVSAMQLGMIGLGNERFSSRGEGDFANKVLSAMRHAFGGHQEKPAR